MKLSFTSKSFEELSFNQLIEIAKTYGFSGIELCGLEIDLPNPSALARLLINQSLEIPCLDCIFDLANSALLPELLKSVSDCKRLSAPSLRVRAKSDDIGAVYENLAALVEEAEKSEVSILIETVGIFADTASLREVLNHFSSDHLAALWELSAPFKEKGESAEETITNLGAYVRHVHIKDFDESGYCLIGEGILPISDMIDALRSINYSGFVSLEWDFSWLSELSSHDIIFTQFMSFMQKFGGLSRAKSRLYDNKAKTGKFIWKKESIIDYTFPRLLDRICDEFPDQYAFKYTTLDYTRTYSEFRDDVDNFARALIALGVKPGDKVAIWTTNLPQWFICFWATTKIGAILVTVNTAYKIHEAEYLFRQSDTHTIVMQESYRDSHYSNIISEICPELENSEGGSPLHCKRLPFLRNIITVGFSKKGCLSWDESLEYSEKASVEELSRRARAIDSHDVANIQYTSGTTGFPKGVMLTHHNIINNGKCIGDRMDLSTADRMLIHVPMFHCFGMVLSMTACVSHASTMCPLPYFSPKPALACVNQEKITAINGVPTMFIAMLNHEDFDKTDFSYVRTGIMAGSPCPVSVMQDVQNKMKASEITIVYGQTESSPGCTMSRADDPIDVRVSTVGSPLPEVECKICDAETGEELPDNTDGEFCVRGYNIMKGYYKMPGATAKAIDKDGFLHTGDLARRDSNGNYMITGRIRDMIIRGGENIYPKEIEDFIYTHEKVADVQVIGVEDEKYGEEICAVVILKEGQALSETELQDYCKASMARHKCPRYVKFVKEFPMNAAGKILKYKMREEFNSLAK
ncbi:AMP-binding protein [Clostridiaceae bacterium OttesenSCG-928-D20]|nr:AMP-binding protein [Clostridiaceae bacterium OttesenSCG-928-D20]